jgi:hypothetical protein
MEHLPWIFLKGSLESPFPGERGLRRKIIMVKPTRAAPLKYGGIPQGMAALSSFAGSFDVQGE